VHQLRLIARAARSAPEIRPLKQTFKEGERVLVKYGPLRGTTGYVQRDEGRATLCINVDILGSAVAVSVSPGDIEKLDD
jgi:transcription antitermination factor NusG